MSEKTEVNPFAGEGSHAALSDDQSRDALGGQADLNPGTDDWSGLIFRSDGHPCPLCSVGELLRAHRGNSVVWQCNNDSVCLYETGDYEGRPLQRFACYACSRPLTLSGDYGGIRRWACSGFFDEHRRCETAHPNVDGRPAFHLGQRLGKPINGNQLPAKKGGANAHRNNNRRKL